MLLNELERYGWKSSPWQDIDRLQREMNRLFSSFDSYSSAEFPAVNLWVNNDNAILTAEIPGVNSDNIDISVLEKTFTIKGSREHEGLKEGEKYHRQERKGGKFSRCIELPFRVATDKVNASFKNGVLHVTLPRLEEDKPRKITVKAA